jgi:hypothetical protein
VIFVADMATVDPVKKTTLMVKVKGKGKVVPVLN